MPIEPGLTLEIRWTVREEDTAHASSGGTLPKVLSTPRMISLMEQTGFKALQPLLEPGQTTVGSVVNIRHLAATPVGMEVRVRAELIRAEGRRMVFHVEAWDAVEKIGDGEHERFIIDLDRFNERLAKKASGKV